MASLTRVRRSALDIIEAILRSIPEEGIRKTRLANKAMLDYKVMERYLNIVLEEGLAVEDGGGYIRITDRGKSFLNQYREVKKLIKIERIFERR